MFRFKVGRANENKKYSHIATTIDGIEICKPDENLKIYYNTNSYVQSTVEITKVEMNKFKTALFFTLFLLHSICINLVHPITTTYVNNLNLPDYYFGFFYSLMSLGQVIGAIIFGSLSDKIGRKWLIVLGIVGYALSQLGFGFINTFPLLILLFRVMAGVFISAPNTLFISLCLDISTTEKKVKYLSILNCISLLGASIGYEIGGSLYNYANLTIAQIFIFQFILCLTTSSIFALFMKDNKRVVQTTQDTKKFSFKILLLIDNAPDHPRALMEMKNEVNVVFCAYKYTIHSKEHGSHDNFDFQMLLLK
jgi:MFS family permease